MGSKTGHYFWTTERKKMLVIKLQHGNSLAVQWLGLGASTARMPGSILVGELRSHMFCGATKKKIF